MGIFRYNILALCISLIIVIYCFTFRNTYKKDICTKQILSKNSVTTTQSSIHLTNIPLGISALYIIISIFLAITILGQYYFSKYFSEKFSHLGFFRGIFAFLVKNLPKLNKLLHYVIFLLIIIQWGIIFGTTDCRNAEHTQGTSVTKGKMHRDSIIVIIVVNSLWFLLNFLMPCVKKYLHIEPAFYEPVDPDQSAWRYYLCEFFGI